MIKRLGRGNRLLYRRDTGRLDLLYGGWPISKCGGSSAELKATRTGIRYVLACSKRVRGLQLMVKGVYGMKDPKSGLKEP